MAFELNSYILETSTAIAFIIECLLISELERVLPVSYLQFLFKLE
jgi:hypothetical protein